MDERDVLLMNLGRECALADNADKVWQARIMARENARLVLVEYDKLHGNVPAIEGGLEG